MKTLALVMLAISVFATTALAAQTVYLKDGGTIRAQSVWRTKGKVHVLVNRDTLTDFSTTEVDLKRTFRHKRHAVQKKSTMVKSQGSASGQSAASASEPHKAAASDGKHPAAPALSGKDPESLIPADKAGSIRKHKKDMAEKLAE